MPIVPLLSPSGEKSFSLSVNGEFTLTVLWKPKIYAVNNRRRQFDARSTRKIIDAFSVFAQQFFIINSARKLN